jgi:GNAT superfamily N-acetyltransferase
MEPTWTVRPAEDADYPHFVRFFAELGVPDPVPDPARWSAEIRPGTIFLVSGGEPIAYGRYVVLGDTAHVAHVVVDPSARGRGVGRALMAALADTLRAAGCSRWFLNVKVDNTPALRLYARCGFDRVHDMWLFSLDWDKTTLLPREEGELTARPMDASEDASIEGAFGLVPGRIADLRGRAGRLLIRLVDRARPDDARVGFACFDPAFPGAFPFTVARPTLAAPLLDAMQAHARPGDRFTRLAVEGDVQLAAALRAAGAEVLLELAHLRGTIP